MKNKFTLGIIAGMSSLALAVPVVAQIASAATDTPMTGMTTSADAGRVRPEFKQPTLQEMIDNDTALLGSVDSMVTTLKAATTAHKVALTAAVSLTGTAQQDAIKKANEDFRTAMKTAMEANPNFKGGMMMFGGPGGKHGGPGHMKFKANLAEKLGMTEAELKAALDGGKTIEQIATEKGVTLPTRPMMGGKGGHRGMKNAAATMNQ
jgi:hypothetical protein